MRTPRTSTIPCIGFHQNDMHRTLARDEFPTGESQLDEINVAKEAFARAEEHWGYRQVQLVDEAGAKILPNGRDTSDTNVFPIRGSRGSLEGAVDSIRHEMERRSALRPRSGSFARRSRRRSRPFSHVCTCCWYFKLPQTGFSAHIGTAG